jgi:hypothetical protein
VEETQERTGETELKASFRLHAYEKQKKSENIQVNDGDATKSDERLFP